jgi:hypothetical protein
MEVPMADQEPARQLYDRIMGMHDQTFREGRYDLAYHLLAAALHAGEELNNVELLDQIGALAAKCQRIIDSLKPDHRLSSNSAKHRGNHAQFTALTAIAAAAKGRITADRALERSRTTRANLS